MISDAEYEQDRIEAAADIKEAGKQVDLMARVRTGGSERSPIFEDAVIAQPWVLELHQRLKNLDGSLAPSTAHTLMVSTEGLPPDGIERSHVFRIAGQRFAVLDIRPLRPGNITIYWEVDLGG